MKIIFTCGGQQTRWNNYMNCPKHLVPINGVPLLKRNIKAFNTFFNCNYYVAIRNESLQNIYNIDENIRFFIPINLIENEPLYKTIVPFLNAYDEDILILLGDVIYSDDCVQKIYDNTLKNTFNVFGRKNGSNITGCKWGELFAFYVPQSFKTTFVEAINKVDHLYQQNKINRFSGWELISYIYSKNKNNENVHYELKNIFKKRLFPDSFIEINDETEDFDFPADYDNYLKIILSKA